MNRIRNSGIVRIIYVILVVALVVLVLIQNSHIRKMEEPSDSTGIAFCIQNLYSTEMITLQQITEELTEEDLSENDIYDIKGKVSTINVTAPDFAVVYRSFDDPVQECLADDEFFNETIDAVTKLKEYCIRLNDTMENSGASVNIQDLLTGSEFRKLNQELNEEIIAVRDGTIVDLESDGPSMKLNKTEQEKIMIHMQKIKETSEKLSNICYEYHA